MSQVHLTQFFRTSPRAALFDETEQIMDRLLDLEEQDDTVSDSTVSADNGKGLVTIEVYAHGDSREAAEQAALSRIHDAVSSVVRIHDREQEWEPADVPVEVEYA